MYPRHGKRRAVACDCSSLLPCLCSTVAGARAPPPWTAVNARATGNCTTGAYMRARAAPPHSMPFCVFAQTSMLTLPVRPCSCILHCASTPPGTRADWQPNLHAHRRLHRGSGERTRTYKTADSLSAVHPKIARDKFRYQSVTMRARQSGAAGVRARENAPIYGLR